MLAVNGLYYFYMKILENFNWRYLSFPLFFVCLISCKEKRPEDPNIIMIVTDDLGWYDLTCYGNDFIESPNLDQLANEGIRFTDAYAPAPLCSASRASIITGLHPISVDITEHIHGNPPARPDQKLKTPPIAQQLGLEFKTIAEALKEKKYKTAFFGKWHLGGGKFTPDKRGFDLNIAGAWNGLPKSFFYPFFTPGEKPELQNTSKEGDYLTDVLTNKTIEYIEQQKDSTFFISLNYYSPHVPIEAKPELVEKYRRKRGADTTAETMPNIHYAAMVESIDENVGRIINTLKTLDLDENTLIVFTSDNGGLHVPSLPEFIKHTPPTDNGPLREGKGYVYEGGIREPLIIHWPRVIKNARIDSTVVTAQDFYNTFMDIVGLEQTSDGMSLLPIFQGEQLKERGLLWHLPHYNHQGSKPSTAYREGDWKIIYSYEDDTYELFNLKKDISESKDLSNVETEKLEELKQKMNKELKELNAKFPEPNPDYIGESGSE
ncbi:sulfatase [Flagellimonas meridianipacifica]|uniref:Arylsulfatase A-like enzyme n=1 Tax=Flagellimonas meridianipacifica TaxID=1080225 RepID=A0A2T0M8J7_9FLAO|nr:sulfatase [Allomuricauda pacifica]PRX53799.1 arylsulfatase A-like enzyme [Allomuricauda pacifica]